MTSSGGKKARWRWLPWAVGSGLLLVAAILGGLFYLLAPPRWDTPPARGPDVGALLARNVRLERSPARPYLGITYQELKTQARDHSDMPAIAGAVVASVAPGSPAAMGGLRAGDVILAVNGEALGRENPLVKVLVKHQPGDRVKLMVQRGQEHVSLEVLLGKQ